MWSAATCHCRDRHHDARMGLRTALGVDRLGGEKAISGLGQLISRRVPAPKHVPYRLPHPLRYLRLEGLPDVTDSGLPAHYKVNLTLPGHCLKLRLPA